MREAGRATKLKKKRTEKHRVVGEVNLSTRSIFMPFEKKKVISQHAPFNMFWIPFFEVLVSPVMLSVKIECSCYRFDMHAYTLFARATARRLGMRKLRFWHLPFGRPFLRPRVLVRLRLVGVGNTQLSIWTDTIMIGEWPHDGVE